MMFLCLHLSCISDQNTNSVVIIAVLVLQLIHTEYQVLNLIQIGYRVLNCIQTSAEYQTCT